MNNTGIIACTNGGSFEAGTEFGGFTLSIPVKDGFIFDGWYSDATFSGNSKLVADNNGKYIGEAKNPYIKDEPKTATPTKVESSKTFDPGVALYAGMALVSAAGMAWTVRKRGE